MLSQRAILTLQGINIHLPNRYKIRKQKQMKVKIDLQEKDLDKNDLQIYSPFLIESKRTSVIKKNTEPIFKTNQNVKNPSQEKDERGQLSYKKQEQKKPNLIRVRQYGSVKINKRCTCGDCEECLKNFTYYLHLFSDDQSIPQITAKSWCIWKKNNNNKFLYYYGKRIHKVRQIASLSKMITAMTAMDFLNKNNYQPSRINFKIKKSSLTVGGTSANLVLNQSYSLIDLFYGMMLPSGNDAAVAMSQVIGLLSFLKGRNKFVNPYEENWDQPYENKNYYYIFIGMMNEKCQKIGTSDTQMFNSHGNDAFEKVKNVSTCNEVAKISSEFVNYPLLKEIVKTTTYKSFENTNKLLEDGFDGIKTGITDTAGPCLAACYKNFIIVVLSSKSMNERWIQVKKLVKWIIKKQ